MGCHVSVGAAFRAVVRFFGAVAITSGTLLIADAAATVAWQEPISALQAWRSQQALDRDLELLLPPLQGGPSPRLEDSLPVEASARGFSGSARRGKAIGRIELPTLDRSYAVVEGTDTESLRRGPGHYPETPFPGEGGTVGIAGHRTTYGAPFRPIDELRRGDRVVVRMPYGRFTYEVERTRIVKPDALWVTRRVGYERLILTACHPLYSAAQRIVVFARLIKTQT